MPKYAALIYTPAETEGQGTPEEWAALMAEYNEFGAQAGEAGVIVGGEALEDTHTATTIHVAGGKGGELIATDGPFAETKEVLGGFYILECADGDVALSLAKSLPAGTVELRPIVDLPS